MGLLLLLLRLHPRESPFHLQRLLSPAQLSLTEAKRTKPKWNRAEPRRVTPSGGCGGQLRRELSLNLCAALNQITSLGREIIIIISAPVLVTDIDTRSVFALACSA